jgi:hypothetical protein
LLPWSHRAIEIIPIYGTALRWLPKTHRFRFIKRRSGGLEAVSRSAIERGSKVVGQAE